MSIGGGSAPPPPDYTPLARANLRAAELQKQTADEVTAEWKRQYKQSRDDLAPWRESGQWAVDLLQKGVERGDFDPIAWKGFTAEMMEADPGYQFRMQEGTKAAHRSMGLSQGRNSGATAKALQRYGQGLASQEFGAARQRAIQDYGMKNAERMQRFNNLSMLAGRGQQATQFGAQLGTQQTGQMGQSMNQGAAALAAGQIGHANALVQGDVARYNAGMAQNALDQQGLNNLFSVVGLGLGAWGMGMKYGAFGA